MPILSDPATLLRLMSPAYGDGVSSLTRIDDAADIARIVFDQAGDMPNSGGLSTLMVDWGQFLDHDLDLTRDASGEFLSVPGLVGPFQRSVYDAPSGTGPDNPRAPVNEITPALDASMVYGSTPERLADLRSFEGGRLAVQDGPAGSGPLMPLAEEGDVMGGAEATDSPIFLAGDIRANENMNLTLLHTLFLREHNHWADRLAGRHPDWSDEQVFQATRAIIEYEIHAITYRDWLPKLLVGNEANPAWDRPVTSFLTPEGEIDGQVTVEFSTAAFRVGHTMVSSQVEVLEESGAPVAGLDLAIEDVVFNVQPLLDGYFDHLLRGQAATLAQEIDGKVIDDLNFFLRAPDGLTGFSLAALNILRARDHGMASYLETRAELIGDVDLAAIAPGDFSVITSDAGVQAELAQVYDSVFDVDLWVGGLIEDRNPGAQVGPVFAYIMIEQFERTRAADAGFLSLPDTLDAAIVAEVEASTIHDVILRNSGITHLQDDPFLAVDRIHGTDSANLVQGTGAGEFLFGLDGSDLLFAEAGNDTLIGGGGNDTLEGGAGIDTAAYSGPRDCYWVELHVDGSVHVTDKRANGDDQDVLENIEALSFADSDWLIQVFDGVVQLSEPQFRSLVELYIATFNRAPDSEGLFFWGNALAKGMGIDEIATLFFDQDETRALYPDLGDPEVFVGDVYRNVLGREADAEGQAFWTGVLARGEVAPAEFVLALLNGVRAPAPDGSDPGFATQQAADLSYLIGKTDIGVYFSAVKGMNDLGDARDVMQMYDGTEGSMKSAKSMMETAYLGALDPQDGGFQLSLIGVVENPFDPTLDNFFFS